MVSVEYARNLGMELTSMEELLKGSDFITIHVPLNQATRGLIGAKELSMVKPTACFINCARGGVIDEGALYKAIEEGRVAGAAIDVFTKEPATDNILLKSDRIIVTPHLGASTVEAQTNVALDVAQEILAVLNDRPTRYAVNAPMIPPDTAPFLLPFLEVASVVGRLVSQLAEGQFGTITIKFEGEIANYDTTALKAASLGGLLESMSEERVNLVNANLIAQERGLKVIEHKGLVCENYGNLVTMEVNTSAGTTRAAGTLMRGEVHIVRVNDYWIDIVPSGGYWLFSDHLDRPGLIGAVGTITGSADVDISFMQVSRQKPRGPALMVLGLDEPIPEEQRQQILTIPDVYTAKAVKL